MKEKMEGYTPLQMERIEKGRLSLEQAQDFANLIVTKFEGLDPKKLEPKDYEQAMKEIENLKKWAKGDVRTIRSLIIELKESPVLCTFMTLLTSSLPFTALSFLDKAVASPSFNSIIMAAIATPVAIKMVSDFPSNLRHNAKITSIKELRQLEEETEARLAAEEKHNKSN